MDPVRELPYWPAAMALLIEAGQMTASDYVPICPKLPLASEGASTDAVREAFRVSDAERRRKVDGARTRGPHALSYGDLDFGSVRASADGADKRTDTRAACLVMAWQNGRGELVRLILAMGRPLLGGR